MPPKMKPVAEVDSFVLSRGRGSLFQDKSHLIDFFKGRIKQDKASGFYGRVQRCSYAWEHEEMIRLDQRLLPGLDHNSWLDTFL